MITLQHPEEFREKWELNFIKYSFTCAFLMWPMNAMRSIGDGIGWIEQHLPFKRQAETLVWIPVFAEYRNTNNASLQEIRFVLVCCFWRFQSSLAFLLGFHRWVGFGIYWLRTVGISSSSQTLRVVAQTMTINRRAHANVGGPLSTVERGWWLLFDSLSHVNWLWKSCEIYVEITVLLPQMHQ